ncbi:hypothetical protein B0T20DRAFT_100236 [Sordaria brevicollis]|uniref:Uncharacterized protein n=1 Tax=Sordaria brevicollis TaxID=83679 RepID=A0AAE0NVQ9_SORBR|nr:hypothetical protein B0T20DRAFT_100236 [Sordaria brevicollis]
MFFLDPWQPNSRKASRKTSYQSSFASSISERTHQISLNFHQDQPILAIFPIIYPIRPRVHPILLKSPDDQGSSTLSCQPPALISYLTVPVPISCRPIPVSISCLSLLGPISCGPGSVLSLASEGFSCFPCPLTIASFFSSSKPLLAGAVAASFLFLCLQRMKKQILAMAIPPTAAPTAIPAMAPLPNPPVFLSRVSDPGVVVVLGPVDAVVAPGLVVWRRNVVVASVTLPSGPGWARLSATFPP